MAIIHLHIDQGSIAWHKLRSGIPTASMFDKIITPKRMELSAQRHSYACRLIAERLLNWQADNLDHVAAIAAGKTSEPEAVARFEFVTDTQTTPIGFVTTNDKKFGASPDRAIGLRETSIDTCVEVKAPTIPVQMQRLLFPPEDSYKCQCQGQLWVAEADEGIFYSYHARMPAFMTRTHRDETFIRKLSEALAQFNDELEELAERAKSLGIFEAFAEVVTPLDAARGPGTEQELADMIEGQVRLDMA